MSTKKALLLKNSLVSSAVLMALSSMPIYAAESEATAKEDDIERIMVTSRRKSESVIEIPMNVSTVGAMEIADRNLLGKEDLFRTIAGAASPRGEVVLRGLSGSNESGGTTASEIGTTTTFTDGIPYDFSKFHHLIHRWCIEIQDGQMVQIKMRFQSILVVVSLSKGNDAI